jgi:hypothetical protein
MATYRISVINEHFTSSNEHECGDVVTAWQQAIRGALAIAADQVSHGNPYFGAEICSTRVKGGSGVTSSRSARRR